MRKAEVASSVRVRSVSSVRLSGGMVGWWDGGMVRGEGLPRTGSPSPCTKGALQSACPAHIKRFLPSQRTVKHVLQEHILAKP
eukprot:8226049-Pyramimonas_sp.AAC.1